jgi:hypothetical protein
VRIATSPVKPARTFATVDRMKSMSVPQSVPMRNSGRNAGRIARLGLLAAFVVLAMSVTALLLVPRYSRAVAAADIGTTAPNFQLRDTAGRTVSLADLRGRAVVLFFSSTRDLAGACAAYDARMNKLARQYATDSRVTFLGIDEPALGIQRPASPVLAAAAIAAADTTPGERAFPTLVDDRGSVALRYSAMMFPMVIVIDPRGLVRYRGPFDDNLDVDFTTRHFAAEVLRDVLDDRPSAALVDRR